MVRLAGLRPVTPTTVKAVLSNQLSYSRVKDVADDKQFEDENKRICFKLNLAAKK